MIHSIDTSYSTYHQPCLHRLTAALSLFLTLFMCSQPLGAAQIFMVSDTVKGESADPVFPESIEIESFNWGVNRTPQSGGGLSTPAFDDLTLTKKVDSASVKFLEMAATGQHMSDTILVVRRSGERPLEYLAIKFTDILFTQVVTGALEAEEELMEQVTFEYGKVEFFYRPQNEDGSPGDIQGFCWDVQSNIDC